MTPEERDRIDRMARFSPPSWTAPNSTQTEPATLVIIEEFDYVHTYWLHCDITQLPAGKLLWLA